VNDDPTIQILTPNHLRAFIRVFLLVSLVTVIAAVTQRFQNGRWWDVDYLASIAIPLFLIPTFVCLMFVPLRIQWSAAEFQIQQRFGRQQTLPWTQLYAYGRGNYVFLLQFTNVSTFQIFAGAFPCDE
jgi:hypothetical protein